MVGLCLVWAVHNGGSDADTWYWGALLALAALVAVVVLRAGRARPLAGPVKVALAAFGAYVAWSYLSITWAQAPGVALTGSNRALLYLIVFAVMALAPWRARTGVAALSLYALGVGAIAVVLLLRFASADAVAGLFADGRLEAPTGYFNSNAALFTMAALTAIYLASRRELPILLRGLLAGAACASLQLALIVQSRGWLFTLPLVLLFSVLVVPGRIRFILYALVPAAVTGIAAHRLVAVYNDATSTALDAGARSAGHGALILTVAGLIVVTVAASAEALIRPRRRASRTLRVGASAAVIVAVLAVGAVGASKATHNDPVGFVTREWNGFSHPVTGRASGSYFQTVGSGRYDFWRVAWHAFLAHPVGGLGQDNFEDYYVVRRHTGEEPLWPHSLEMRLLSQTGLVGFLLFAVFLGAAVAAALRARRRGSGLACVAASAALLPLLPWLFHGSVDWFWELPAITGPALGFLGLAAALAGDPEPASHTDAAPSGRRAAEQRAIRHGAAARAAAPVGRRGLRNPVRVLGALIGLVALVAATLVLTIPYMAVRQTSMAADLALSNPGAALHDLKTAADLNPLDANPDTRAGLLALSIGDNLTAKQRFSQAITREPGAWLPWLGRGLADSALGERQQAATSLRHAYAINNQQPPVSVALHRVFTRRPLTYDEAVPLFRIAR